MARRYTSLPPIDNPAQLSGAAVEKLHSLFLRLDVVIKEKYQPMLQRGDVRQYRECGAEDITALRGSISRLLWVPPKSSGGVLCIMELMSVLRGLLMHEDEPEINAVRRELEATYHRLEEEAHSLKLALPTMPTGVQTGTIPALPITLPTRR